MSKNPVEEYLSEKTAGFGRNFANEVVNAVRPGNLGQLAGRGLVNAGAAAAGAGAVALGTHGAQVLYDAATKARDFRSMLEQNPDLAQKQQEEPKLVNQMFSTLRTFNPAFTRDPVVAGSYVRQMVENPMHAGGIAVEALQYRDKTKNQLGDQVTRAVFKRGE